MTEVSAPIPAIVLAGNNRSTAKRAEDKELAKATGARCRALITLRNGKTCIEAVLQALQQADSVSMIIVVGVTELLGTVTKWGVRFAEQGENVVDNLVIGFDSLWWPERCLVCTCDVPLLTGEAIDFIVQAGLKSDADVVYPIIRKETCEQAFPGARRTYVQLVEGTFTGGNVMLLKGDFVRRNSDLFHSVFAARKQPLKLCRILGLRLILRFMMRRLSISEIEDRVRSVLQCDGKALLCPYPEVGFDIDKLEDLELANAVIDSSRMRRHQSQLASSKLSGGE